MTLTTLLFLAAAQLASAHFGLEYPEWRADSLANESYSQWEYPCAGVPLGAPGANRTDWDIGGGSLTLDLHHPWTYIFVNLGLGDNVTNFNYTLSGPEFWNSTGNGTLCIPKLALPAGLAPEDGQVATIQVVTLGNTGSALYNCADITFRANVKAFGGETCETSPNVSFEPIVQQVNGSSTNGTSSGGNSTGGGSSGTNSGSAMGANMVVLTSVVGLTVAFVYGMSP